METAALELKTAREAGEPSLSRESCTEDIELSIIMPCLNEVETIGVCVRKALHFLDQAGVVGEVIVADNGSTDSSREIARENGARVIQVEGRGYGSALSGGIMSARGPFVIMGDADDSYDFLHLMPFLKKLRSGADLVIGNRFRGGIEPGAMPFLHRFLGNPVLSFLGRLFFRAKVGDFHCGLRGFNRTRIVALDLNTTGMEFASEMVVRAALAGYRITEVPTTLRPDGRSRPPHLRSWSDGWRHLRFLLMYSPRWLFIYPGLVLLGLGILGTAILLPGVFYIGSIGIGIHTFVVSCFATLLGLQSITFGVIARRYGAKTGFLPASSRFGPLLRSWTLERVLIVAICMFVLGFGALVGCISAWAWTGFGPLNYSILLRVLLLSLTAIAAAVQLAFTAFLAGVMEIPTRTQTVAEQH
jgi:glycosyltransferase involved in cell wall biosynthesis